MPLYSSDSINILKNNLNSPMLRLYFREDDEDLEIVGNFNNLKKHLFMRSDLTPDNIIDRQTTQLCDVLIQLKDMKEIANPKKKFLQSIWFEFN